MKLIKKACALMGIFSLALLLFFLFLPYGVYIEYQVKFNPIQAWSFVMTQAPIEYVINSSETDQGVTGNGRTVKAFLNAIGTTRKATIKVLHTSTSDYTDYSVSTGLTITSNVATEIDHGARFGGAGTLTINGPFEAGWYQVFSGTGTVTFGSGAIKEAYPQWKGAKSDGPTTDDIVAIQAMADSLPAGGKLVFIKGSSYYKINSTLDIDQQDNITLEFQNGAEIRLGASGTDGINITKDHVTILNAIMEGEGTYVTAGASGTGASLIKSSGDFTTIKECYLKEPEQCGIHITGSTAVIKYNTIEGGQYFADAAAIGTDRQHFGIYISGSSRSKVKYNEIIPNSEANAGAPIQGIYTATGDLLLLSGQIIGNTIKNCWDHALYLHAERCTIANNQAYGCGCKVHMRASGTSVAGNVVANNMIHVGAWRRTAPLAGDKGLSFFNPKWSTITGNVIKEAADYGIYMYSEDPFVISNNVITGNMVEDVADGASTDACGLYVETVSTFANNIITGNSFKTMGSDTDGEQAGIVLSLTDTDNHIGNVISGNSIEDSQEHGIKLVHLTGSIISGNTINDIGKGAALPAIYANDVNRCQISDNLIYGVGAQMTYGYHETGSNWNWLRDNYIYNADTAMWHAANLGANTKTDNNWDGT